VGRDTPTFEQGLCYARPRRPECSWRELREPENMRLTLNRLRPGIWFGTVPFRHLCRALQRIGWRSRRDSGNICAQLPLLVRWFASDCASAHSTSACPNVNSESPTRRSKTSFAIATSSKSPGAGNRRRDRPCGRSSVTSWLASARMSIPPRREPPVTHLFMTPGAGTLPRFLRPARLAEATANAPVCRRPSRETAGPIEIDRRRRLDELIKKLG